jgi:hypothetical protein
LTLPLFCAVIDKIFADTGREYFRGNNIRCGKMIFLLIFFYFPEKTTARENIVLIIMVPLLACNKSLTGFCFT